MRPLLLLVNMNILTMVFYFVCSVSFIIFIIEKAIQRSDEHRKNQKLKPVLYKQILEEEEIYCPAGKKLMALIDTLVNQPDAVYHVQEAAESDEARRIREEGGRTSRIRYCLQCIEENVRYDENSTQETLVLLATTGDSLLWNHQVLNYLQSFAPALKVVADGINTVFEEEYSVDSFKRIRNTSAAYGMLYKYLNELAICCDTAKGIAVDKAEMQLLSELLRGSGRQLAVMPTATKRQLENNPQNDYVSISIPWNIDELLLAKIKAKVETRYQQWKVSEDIRGNHKRVKKVVEFCPLNQRSPNP